MEHISVKRNIYKFLIYSLFTKLSVFLFSAAFTALQSKHNASVSLATFTIYLQWTSVSAIFDFGFINWVSITRRPAVAQHLFARGVLSASLFVALIFNLYFAFTTWQTLEFYDYILSFIDTFISYYLLCKSFLFAKQSLFKDAVLLQLSSVAGFTFFTLLCFFYQINFSFSAVLCFGLAIKLVYIYTYFLKSSPTFRLHFNLYKYISSLRFSSRYLFLQICTFFQFGCDYFIGFYIFNPSDFNNYAATLRVLQSSLFVSGVVSSLLINYSLFKFKRSVSTYVICFSIGLQALFCYLYGQTVGVTIDYYGLVYISALATIGIMQTQQTINDSFSILRLYTFTTIPVLILKVFFIFLLNVDGLAIVTFIQLLLLLLLTSFYVVFIRRFAFYASGLFNIIFFNRR